MSDNNEAEARRRPEPPYQTWVLDRSVDMSTLTRPIPPCPQFLATTRSVLYRQMVSFDSFTTSLTCVMFAGTIVGLVLILTLTLQEFTRMGRVFMGLGFCVVSIVFTKLHCRRINGYRLTSLCKTCDDFNAQNQFRNAFIEVDYHPTTVWYTGTDEYGVNLEPIKRTVNVLTLYLFRKVRQSTLTMPLPSPSIEIINNGYWRIELVKGIRFEGGDQTDPASFYSRDNAGTAATDSVGDAADNVAAIAAAAITAARIADTTSGTPVSGLIAAFVLFV